MFADAPRFAKSANIFFHERFPIYGMCIPILAIPSMIHSKCA